MHAHMLRHVMLYVHVMHALLLCAHILFYVRFQDLDGARAALVMSGIVIKGSEISIEQAADAERDMKRDAGDVAKLPANVSWSCAHLRPTRHQCHVFIQLDACETPEKHAMNKSGYSFHRSCILLRHGSTMMLNACHPHPHMSVLLPLPSLEHLARPW
jgi:hypothetical protein